LKEEKVMPTCPFCGTFIPEEIWNGRCPCGEILPDNINQYFRERCPFVRTYPYPVGTSDSMDLEKWIENLGH
jgi:hypothetical protein